MKLRQPTRCPKIKMVTIESRLNSTSGKIHVGRCAMDSKVGLGLKITPKIRPTELTDGADSGEGVTGLAMFFSSDGQRVEALVPGSSTLGRCEKLQAGRVYRNSGELGNVDPAGRAIDAPRQFWERDAVTSCGNLRHRSD